VPTLHHATRTRARSTPRYAVLRLEELESRDLPSAIGFTVQPFGGMAPLRSSSFSAVYSPAQIRAVYGFSQLPYSGLGQTIAIVDAYDDPNIYQELQVFDQAAGLPNPTAFAKFMPYGQPAADYGWSAEIALDVEWAHAIAPLANIFLVEAPSASAGYLLGSMNYARQLPGVSVVSMSWGGPEFYGESAYDGYFTTPLGHIAGGMGRTGGITFVAATGDTGAGGGVEWPSVSPNVLAVGGTTLQATGGTYLGESAWSGSGGGYSKYVSEPAYQRLVQTVGVRSLPDVSYNADPNTGVYAYLSYTSQPGWYSFGGTSAGAPQWAALIALADEGRARLGLGSISNAQATLYTLPQSDFHDVAGGSNGFSAVAGYDAATGLGSPVANLLIQQLITYGSSTQGMTVAGRVSVGTVSTVSKKIADTFDPIDATPHAAVTNDDVWTTPAASPSPVAPAWTARDDVVRSLVPAHLGRHSWADATLADLVFGEGNLFSDPAE
jgi:subtilase family serine protease